jgi:hypothetical protein
LKTPATAALLTILLLGGCAHLGGYSVSEATLEQHLRRSVAEHDRQLLQDGAPLTVSLRDVRVQLGPDGRDVVVLDVAGEAAFHGFGTRLPLGMQLKVEGAPVYDSREQAVYIRRLQLLESRVDSPLIETDLAPAARGMMGILAQLLEHTPVYRLDTADWRQRALAAVPLDLRVEPGRLVLMPGR